VSDMFADDHHIEHIQAALEGTGHATVDTGTVGPGEDGGPTAPTPGTTSTATATST